MGKHVFVVFTNGREGLDEEFNRWYDDVHLVQVCEIDGVDSARRFQASHGYLAPPWIREHGDMPWKYLTIYEVSGDPQEITDALDRGRASGDLEIAPLYDREQMVAWFFESRDDGRPNDDA